MGTKFSKIYALFGKCLIISKDEQLRKKRPMLINPFHSQSLIHSSMKYFYMAECAKDKAKCPQVQ